MPDLTTPTAVKPSVPPTIVAPDAAPVPSVKDEAKASREAQKKSLKLAKPDDEQKSGKKMPNIGETVHYVTPFGKRGEHRPMVVTSIAHEDRASVNGHVMLEPQDGIGDTHYFATEVPYYPEKLVGSWHYAEDPSETK